MLAMLNVLSFINKYKTDQRTYCFARDHNRTDSNKENFQARLRMWYPAPMKPRVWLHAPVTPVLRSGDRKTVETQWPTSLAS